MLNTETLDYQTENEIVLETHELDEVKDIVSKLEICFNNVGKLSDEIRTLEIEYEKQKSQLGLQLGSLNQQLDELKKDRNKITSKLTKKYGFGELDISTGKYTKK